MGKAKKKAPKTPKTFAFITTESPEGLRERVCEAVRAKGEMLYEDTEAGFDLGVSRGGHSGGYWYVATLIEGDGETAVSGEIVFRSYHKDGELREDTKREKVLEGIGIGVLAVLLFPVFLIAIAWWGIRILWGKLRGSPLESTMSDGEKLTHFMTEVMGCNTIE